MLIYLNEEERAVMDSSIADRLKVKFIYHKDGQGKIYWETFAENFGAEVKKMLRQGMHERGHSFKAGLTIKNGEAIPNGDEDNSYPDPSIKTGLPSIKTGLTF